MSDFSLVQCALKMGSVITKKAEMGGFYPLMVTVVFWCRNALVGIMKAVSLLLCTNSVGRPHSFLTLYIVGFHP